jgi:hypothetical protein
MDGKGSGAVICVDGESLRKRFPQMRGGFFPTLRFLVDGYVWEERGGFYFLFFVNRFFAGLAAVSSIIF